MAARDQIRSVGRALALLDALAEAGAEGARVTDLAARLMVDKSTVSRLLSTLEGRGYAGRLSNRRYGLGAHSIGIATSHVSPLVQRAAPHMARVASIAGETVHLIKLVGNEPVTIARLESTRRVPYVLEVQTTYPLWATAAGWCLLASLPPLARLRLLPAEPYPAFTPRTAGSARALWARLRRGLREGIFCEEGEFVAGVSCYAVALRCEDLGETVALAISFDSARPERERRPLREALRRGTRSLDPT